MRQGIVWQYALLAAGWILAVLSMPLRGANVNGFLTWRGTTTTQGLVRWFFTLPRIVVSEWSDPAVSGGIGPGGRVAASTFAFGDLLWLAGVLFGFILFLLSPVMVRRSRTWGKTERTVISCLAPVLLVFPAATLAPRTWGLPLPATGMWLLCAGHVLVCAALLLTPAANERTAAFPVELKA